MINLGATFGGSLMHQEVVVLNLSAAAFLFRLKRTWVVSLALSFSIWRQCLTSTQRRGGDGIHSGHICRDGFGVNIVPCLQHAWYIIDVGRSVSSEAGIAG